jgi:hypothetical protein
MRPGQYTLRPCHVYSRACGLLQTRLRLQDYKSSVPAVLLVSLLLLAALAHTSLYCACQLHPDRPCYQSVRNSLHANLPRKQSTLLDYLLQSLLDTLPDWLLRSPQVCAIDLHQRCFYGKKTTKGCTRGKSKKGTKKFFSYATLAILSPLGRFTIGLVAVYPKMLLQNIVEQLLDQAQRVELSIAYLMLDREFASAEVIRVLQHNDLGFLIAAPKTGKKQGTGNRHFFEANCKVGWYKHSWTTPRRVWDFKAKKRKERGKITVEVDVCVARGNEKKPRLVYYCGQMRHNSVGQVKKAYRRRFGIESGYRQLGECLARTSSRNVKVRLLLVGIALVLVNLWAYVHAEVLGSGPLGERQPHLYLLRLTILRILLLLEILKPSQWLWLTQRPFPDTFTSAP